jgi:hypothetical protein
MADQTARPPGPLGQGEYVRIFKVTLDDAALAAHQAGGGGKRRALAEEEASCTKDYVHSRTSAISAECPRWGSSVSRGR